MVRAPMRIWWCLPLVAMACHPAPKVELQVGEVVSDFKLADVNPDSASYQQEVSPRDDLGKVSAWYFGHSG